MKRTWIALVLFTLVTGLCIYERVFFNMSIEALTNEITQAQASAINEELDMSINQTQDTFQRWKSDHKKLAMFISHDQLESVDQSFSTLIAQLECEEVNDFIVESTRLSEQLNQLKESENLSIHNIF